MTENNIRANCEETVLVAVPGSFAHALQDATLKYESKKYEYGETWKTMPVSQLRHRWNGEIIEAYEKMNAQGEYEEMMDVLLLSLMIMARLYRIQKEAENAPYIRDGEN
jgi:aromatic ring-opening dioxygenase catalytic subunit (LigB family)